MCSITLLYLWKGTTCPMFTVFKQCVRSLQVCYIEFGICHIFFVSGKFARGTLWKMKLWAELKVSPGVSQIHFNFSEGVSIFHDWLDGEETRSGLGSGSGAGKRVRAGAGAHISNIHATAGVLFFILIQKTLQKASLDWRSDTCTALVLISALLPKIASVVFT